MQLSQVSLTHIIFLVSKFATVTSRMKTWNHCGIYTDRRRWWWCWWCWWLLWWSDNWTPDDGKSTGNSIVLFDHVVYRKLWVEVKLQNNQKHSTYWLEIVLFGFNAIYIRINVVMVKHHIIIIIEPH